jgi:hypothetical protein
MGDEPVVSRDVLLYQRLLAGDQDEASDLVERALAAGLPRERVYDETVLPALALASHDRARGRIDADELRVVVEGAREIVEDLLPSPATGPAPAHRVLAAAARGEADAVALLMLRGLLAPAGVALDLVSPELLAAEVLDHARRHGADIVVVGALPPDGLAQARYFCKRARAGLPGVRIVAARWCATAEVEAVRRVLLGAGAHAVGTSLGETRDLILQLVRVRPALAAAPVV